jgi:uncharacterized protein
MEVHVFPAAENASDKWIIYRPLIGLAFIGNRSMADLAVWVASHIAKDNNVSYEPSTEAERFLAGIGFFAPDPQLPEVHTDLHKTTLLLTNRCQLRCIYCYASAGESGSAALKLQTGKVAINFASQRAAQKGLSYFELELHGGGEPTLEWRLLQELVAYARSRPLPARISLTSNAVWSAQQCDWICVNLNSLSISMDGSPITQDHNRPFSNHKASSKTVMRNLHQLDERGFSYGIRMTVTAPWQRLPEDVRYICENTRCRAIQVEPAFNTQRGQRVAPDEDQYTAFMQAFIMAYEVARQHQARFHFSGARPGSPTNVFCRAPYYSLVVTPFDQIAACYEITDNLHPLAASGILGKVEGDQLSFDVKARDRLHARLKERSNLCKDCYCRWTCAGGCFARFFAPGDDGHLVYNRRCDIHRQLTRYLILEYISANNGVWHANQTTAGVLEDDRYG